MSRPKKEKQYFPQRLMSSLMQIGDYRVTAICGPFGTGKTTAMLEYCERQKKRGTRLFWYTYLGETLDISWIQICEHFSDVNPIVAEELKTLGFPHQQNFSQLATLMQKIQCTEETVLVIDNTQLFYSKIPYELIYALSRHNEKICISWFLRKTALPDLMFRLAHRAFHSLAWIRCCSRQMKCMNTLN